RDRLRWLWRAGGLLLRGYRGRRAIRKRAEAGLGMRPTPGLQRAALAFTVIVAAFHPNGAVALNVEHAFGSEPGLAKVQYIRARDCWCGRRLQGTVPRVRN